MTIITRTKTMRRTAAGPYNILEGPTQFCQRRVDISQTDITDLRSNLFTECRHFWSKILPEKLMLNRNLRSKKKSVKIINF